MMGPEQPPFIPPELSDEAAHQILTFLYELAGMVESYYFAQLRRYTEEPDEELRVPFDDELPF